MRIGETSAAADQRHRAALRPRTRGTPRCTSYSASYKQKIRERRHTAGDQPSGSRPCWVAAAEAAPRAASRALASAHLYRKTMRNVMTTMPATIRRAFRAEPAARCRSESLADSLYTTCGKRCTGGTRACVSTCCARTTRRARARAASTTSRGYWAHRNNAIPSADFVAVLHALCASARHRFALVVVSPHVRANQARPLCAACEQRAAVWPAALDWASHEIGRGCRAPQRSTPRTSW